MLSFFAVLLFIFYPLVVKGQCYSCDKFWNADCKPRVEGFHCDPGTTIISSNPSSALATMYDDCSLPHHEIRILNDFCCVYSPQIGCNIALNPKSFANRPSRYCTNCFQPCNCTKNLASMPQAWHWGKLCIISSLFIQFVYPALRYIVRDFL